MFQLPTPEVGADEARDIADQVLSGRAYAEARRPPSLQERLFDWIADLFSELFGALSSSGGRGITAWLVIIVFGLLIAYLLSRLVRGRGTLPERAATVSPQIDVLGEHSAEEWLAQAERAEANGDFRVGIRCRHRSLATRLLNQGLIIDRPGQTAGEIARVVAESRPDVADAINQATWLFKDSWYGWIEADAATRDRFAALAEQVLVGLDQRSQVAVSA